MPDISYMGEAVHGRSEPMEHWHNARFWGLHLYRYDAMLLIDGKEFPIRAGYAGVVPPDVDRDYHFYGPSVHTYVHFTFPCAQPGEGTTPIPAMQDLGGNFNATYEELLKLAALYTTQRVRSNVKLWEILWRLTEIPGNPLEKGTRQHPAVQSVALFIEQNLAEPLVVGQLARKVDLTNAHLSRLFKSAFGVTVTGFIRGRRVERAKQLLTHSALPIKAIAVATGIPDLHRFNKIIHRELGAAPRELRREK